MGGFVLCDKNGQPTKVLTFPHFRRLLDEGVIDFPCLTSSEIQERSNFHPAFALVAFLQAAWFITRCFSRLINASLMDPGIPVITQLEAMAAAIVVVNWCTFFFAWEKPLDARSHILILIKATASPSTHHDRYQLRGPDTIVTEDFEREENLSGLQGTERRIQLEFPELQSTSISKSIASFRITPLALLSTLFWPITSISIDLFNKLVPEESGPLEFPDGTLNIPLFYVQNTMPQHTVLLPAITVGAGVSIFFLLLRPGSILYLSSWAARLWWAASISSTMLTVCMLASAILASVFYLLTFPLSPSNCMHACLTGLSNLFKSPFLSTLSLWLGLFFFYRVVSLAAAVISFRSTVGVVFWGRSWVDYIPHFF